MWEVTIEPQDDERWSQLLPLREGYARLLGWAGAFVLPALFLLVLVWPEMRPYPQRIGVIYAGGVLSFLGGIQWGFAMVSGRALIRLRRLAVGVTPTLWMVAALSLPVLLGAFALMLGLVLLLVYEWLERGDAVYPQWYLSLRLQLTAAMCVGLGLLTIV